MSPNQPPLTVLLPEGGRPPVVGLGPRSRVGARLWVVRTLPSVWWKKGVEPEPDGAKTSYGPRPILSSTCKWCKGRRGRCYRFSTVVGIVGSYVLTFWSCTVYVHFLIISRSFSFL